MSDLVQKDAALIWHPFTPLVGNDDPLLVKSAEGIYLHLTDGRKVIDAVSSWWVNLHGHSHPHIVKALQSQIAELDHVIFAGFTHEPAIKLAENLLMILPANQSKVFFSDNGSTAVEVALKMSFQFWTNQGIARKKVIAIEGSYHGDTVGAMSVGSRGMFTAPFDPYLFDVLFIDFPISGSKTVEQFSTLVHNNEIGAFIFEPLVQGAGGMRMYSPQILDELIRIARSNGVVCIADEVFTGFGRTGKMFASDYLDEKPDIICISKGITGGTMPLGVTSCSEKIIKAFTDADFSKTFFHGHSYTGNPLACAVANASYELLVSETCQQQIRAIGNLHEEFALTLKSHPRVKEARSLGTILAIELHTPEGTSYANEIRKSIYSFFMSRDILLRPLGNIIYMLPPYCITAAELNRIYRCIEEFLDQLG